MARRGLRPPRDRRPDGPAGPANVAGLLRDAAGTASSSTASPTRVVSRAATLLSTPGGLFSISDSSPHTLLRLASGSSPAATGPLRLADGTDTSVSALSGTDREAFTTGIERDLTDLKTAVDPTVTFTTVGKARFSPAAAPVARPASLSRTPRTGRRPRKPPPTPRSTRRSPSTSRSTAGRSSAAPTSGR